MRSRPGGPSSPGIGSEMIEGGGKRANVLTLAWDESAGGGGSGAGSPDVGHTRQRGGTPPLASLVPPVTAPQSQ